MKIALAQISMCNYLQKNLEKSLEYCDMAKDSDLGESKKWQEKVPYLETRRPQWYIKSVGFSYGIKYIFTF